MANGEPPISIAGQMGDYRNVGILLRPAATAGDLPDDT